MIYLYRMKIGVAQTRPFKGDIARNIEAHKKLIGAAVAAGADLVVFPELSVTGYEPELAKELATSLYDPDPDPRLDVFQILSDQHSITIGVGIPTKSDHGILITMMIFQPGEPRQIYSKQYLHADEEPYFVPGGRPVYLDDGRIALAICYELCVPAHSERAYRDGAGIYLVSVAKTAAGMEKAAHSLTEIARKYNMTVLLSNCVGPCDNFESGGGSAVWSNKGELLEQLNNSGEGLLVFDTDTGRVAKIDGASL